MQNPGSNIHKAIAAVGSYRVVKAFLKRSGSLSSGIAATWIAYIAYKVWKGR